MKLNSRYRTIVTNLLVAVAISLIINFSIFIFMLMPQPPVWGRVANSLDSNIFLFIQNIYYFILAFILVSIATLKIKGQSPGFTQRILVCVLITAVLYFFAPRYTRSGDIIMLINSMRILDPMILLKVSFTLVVALLYGKIYELVYQKQHIILENEVLKNENLQTTYNTLVNQINPHFFFNSLNSLAMLVRESHKEQALTYIDRLSDTFRYIIQNGQTGIITLEEELKFVDSYKYLLEIRYEGKLFFDISIGCDYLDWTLPSLTLQPLIENIVKHNTITRANPMRVSIITENGCLSVSNPVSPKIDSGEKTGIGLKNLSERYKLLTGKDIKVLNDGTAFCVLLPLERPDSDN